MLSASSDRYEETDVGRTEINGSSGRDSMPTLIVVCGEAGDPRVCCMFPYDPLVQSNIVSRTQVKRCSQKIDLT